MPLFYYYYCLSLLLLFHTEYLLAYPCYDCDSMHFDYLITIDNLPSPTRNDCRTVTSETGCFVHIGWYNDQTSEVFYGSNLGFIRDSVTVRTESNVNILSGLYIIHKYLAYICGSSDSTPCNTVENLKRSVISTSFPTVEQIKQFNELIVPTKTFNSNLCFISSNMTDNCPSLDLPNCQQCFAAVEYSQGTNVCATCPSDEAIVNFFRYDTTFLFNNQTRLDIISLGCQKGDACNSMDNIEKLKQNLMTKFDYDKFFPSTSSTTSTTKSSFVLLLIALFIGLMHCF